MGAVVRARAGLCVLLALGITGATGSASAESAPRTHDGFYFSGGLGLAYLSTSVKADSDNSIFGGLSVSGTGVGGMLLFGGTVAPGMAIGGGTMGGHFATPTVKDGGREGEADHDFVLSLTGPFVDYYFDPGRGLHAVGILGFALLDPGTGGDEYSKGAGAGIGFGYDWWVGDEWSMGVLGRALMFKTSLKQGDDRNTFSTVSPALLFSATYH